MSVLQIGKNCLEGVSLYRVGAGFALVRPLGDGIVYDVCANQPDMSEFRSRFYMPSLREFRETWANAHYVMYYGRPGAMHDFNVSEESVCAVVSANVQYEVKCLDDASGRYKPIGGMIDGHAANMAYLFNIPDDCTVVSVSDLVMPDEKTLASSEEGYRVAKACAEKVEERLGPSIWTTHGYWYDTKSQKSHVLGMYGKYKIEIRHNFNLKMNFIFNRSIGYCVQSKELSDAIEAVCNPKNVIVRHCISGELLIHDYDAVGLKDECEAIPITTR